MPKRSEKRDTAKAEYIAKKKKGEEVSLRALAGELGVSYQTLRNWKAADKWEEALPKKKRGGQPGNQNSKGKRNAAGSHDGAPPGNKNAEKDGAYSTVFFDVLSAEELKITESVPLGGREALEHEMKILKFREHKILAKIAEYESQPEDALFVSSLLDMRTPGGRGKDKKDGANQTMGISITKKTSTHNTTAAAGRAIRYIVVHYTAGVTSKPGSAAGTASYFGGTSKQVSADFIVDDGGAVQYNGDIRNRYTWHCGGGKYNTKGGAYYGKATNRNTIGIEVCSTNDTGKMTVANDSHWRFTDKVVSNLVELVKYLMAEYGIDAAHVIRHYDVNGKPCPGIIGWNEDTGSAAKWAAFKARLGAATPGGQTGGSTGTTTGNTALTYKVGDIVQFAGGKHYANAQATSGTTVKPGPAKVTVVATAGKHPYHLVHTDGTSTVYGWVDAAAITGKASATPAVKTYTVKAGDSLWRIAAQQLGNGARYKEIKTLNGLKNNTIHAGQVLKLPN